MFMIRLTPFGKANVLIVLERAGRSRVSPEIGADRDTWMTMIWTIGLDWAMQHLLECHILEQICTARDLVVYNDTALAGPHLMLSSGLHKTWKVVLFLHTSIQTASKNWEPLVLKGRVTGQVYNIIQLFSKKKKKKKRGRDFYTIRSVGMGNVCILSSSSSTFQIDLLLKKYEYF